MLNQYKRKRDEGFTIIEVMIVLAIAGLIMLIVFLAVPALQRSSRNTQRTQDVGQIGTAAQDVINNNNGDLTKLSTKNLEDQLPKLAYYTSTNVTVNGSTGTNPPAATPSAITNTDTPDTVTVYIGAVCQAMAAGGGQGATSNNATARQIAVTYVTEGGSNVKDCKAL